MVNWTKVRNEYINGNISYRKLADKYDISVSTLTKRAMLEKWNDKRKEQRKKIETKVLQKTAEKIAEKESDMAVKIAETNSQLLDLLNEAMAQLNKCVVKEKRKYTRQIKDPETGKTVYVDIEEEKPKVAEVSYISKKDLRDVALVLEKIKAIQMESKDDTGNAEAITFIDDMGDWDE